MPLVHPAELPNRVYPLQVSVYAGSQLQRRDARGSRLLTALLARHDHAAVGAATACAVRAWRQAASRCVRVRTYVIHMFSRRVCLVCFGRLRSHAEAQAQQRRAGRVRALSVRRGADRSRTARARTFANVVQKRV